MGRGRDDMAGLLLLGLAVVLHRTVASKRATERIQARRNAMVRAAHRRGVPVPRLAAGLGLTEGWVRKVLNGRGPAVEEETA
ncbi:MAG: hypothetical protein H5T76_32475 [Streptomyces sp.]|uniref:hypothetical protein n=1 Tax=Streptomyces sp. B93 TaxID=2824875 RepID=UPI00198E216D|nr:hypothetical protein [Streptomyces sp. B93]MBC7273358.1 hypothetical protein [Streptomyces sp.]MBQ1088669.1 hypothetical protein [Streptomyces sp. B93]